MIKWKGIVKVQKCLITKNELVLIYSKTGEIEWSGPIESKLNRWFKEGEHKFFAYAELRNTKIHLIHKVVWQNW